MIVNARSLSLILLTAVLLVAVFVAACGGDEKEAAALATAAPTPAATAAPATAPPAPTAPPSTPAAPTETPEPTPETAAVDVGSSVGQVGADFTLTSVDGEEINLNSLRGSPVVLYYFATW